MKIFIKFKNYKVWCVIKVGDHEITTTNGKGDIIPNALITCEKEY